MKKSTKSEKRKKFFRHFIGNMEENGQNNLILICVLPVDIV